VNELQSIFDAMGQLHELRAPAVLATVVHVEGSTYRRPGARMLVTQAGGRIGSVSGGCLESDVVRKAWQLTADNAGAAILTYDSMSDDDGLWGLGLGCNGRIHILVERLQPADDDAFAVVASAFRARRSSAIATVYGVGADSTIHLGSRLVTSDTGEVLHDEGNIAAALPDLVADIGKCLAESQSADVAYLTPTGRVRVLIEVIQPPPALLVCGAGFDARPLVDAAKNVGWTVTLIDRRAGYATRDHFPAADNVIVAPPDRIVELAGPDARTAAVVMHHNYPDDLAALRVLLESDARYVGVLGPHARRDRLLADLAAGGFVPTAEQLSRLYGPVGLDLGAETPAEIAASVVAEILAAATGRRAGRLRDQVTPVHDPMPRLTADETPFDDTAPANQIQCRTDSR